MEETRKRMNVGWLTFKYRNIQYHIKVGTSIEVVDHVVMIIISQTFSNCFHAKRSLREERKNFSSTLETQTFSCLKRKKQ